MQKIKLAFFGIAALAAGLAAGTAANAQTVLNFSIWVPPAHPITANMVVPWAENVAKATKGRVKINILTKPLGGPPQHYDLARDGVADVTMVVHGYTPGRFTLTKVAEMPFLGETAEVTSVAYWRIHEKYLAKADEHKGTKVIGVFTHGPGVIFTKSQTVAKIDDMKGLKFRVGGGVVNDVGKALDMVTVLKPATESYELLSSGVVDGVTLPAESIRSFKLVSLIKHATLFPGGLYNTSFVIAMNKAKFDALPAQDQKAVMSVSGEAFARLAGKAWDAADDLATKDFLAAGGKMTKPSAAFIAEVTKRTAPIEKAWVAEAKKKGVDGAVALAALRAEIKKLEKK